MPELPEVETIKNYLQKNLKGEKILWVRILSKKQFPGQPKRIVNQKILAIQRRAKNLVIHLSNNLALLVHLKLSGQLVLAEKTRKAEKSTRVIIGFNKKQLFFNEMRKFGWIKIFDQKALKQGLAKIGPEPFSKEFSLAYLKTILSKTSRAVKIVLMDQQKIAGIGNIYANEILFQAKIDPCKPAKRLNDQEINRLHWAVLTVLRKGINKGGSSAADELYIKPDGSQGSYQNYFKVYQRASQPCKRCATPIKRILLGNRGTFFCPQCQK